MSGRLPPSLAHKADQGRYDDTIQIDYDHSMIHSVSTKLVRTKNVSIEPRYDEYKNQAIIYLDLRTIVEVGFSSSIDQPKDGFYNAEAIHILTIDTIRGFQQDVESNKSGTLTRSPPLKILEIINEATKISLLMGIEHSGKLVQDCSTRLSEQKEDRLLDQERMKAVLLNGEWCTVWRNDEQISSGRLGFCSFSNVEVVNGGKTKIFNLTDGDILSGKWRIEKATEEKVGVEEGYVQVPGDLDISLTLK